MGNQAERMSIRWSSLQTKKGSDKLQDEIHNSSGEDVGVESVQESAVARDQIPRILQASVPFHNALYEVPAEAGKKDEKS